MAKKLRWSFSQFGGNTMKNYVKKIVASLLAVVFCLGSVQATQAAPEPRATEVWYVGHNYDYDYTMEDTNTTKPKLLGNSGKLVVYGNFYKDDSGASNIKLTAQLSLRRTTSFCLPMYSMVHKFSCFLMRVASTIRPVSFEKRICTIQLILIKL